ncbi:hypothetical protein A2230_02745 [candidate division WOR-1 bacterium RIFOXYA2_FULL_36_21]|uniref:Steroid 5-alpha reductase C-terminal domain-containing protein n=1 Tax=candidate division WOR-1 bacterium RIFOXYB2_FULL_36_35 TaxID=1802578 RepID=A0A1F4S6K9_UNCSA|nr:MAG: hypothetical protein A2230_02745 [candidate division WOR-1 bacterium RIFOXYA2_FULL_36_21]OGC16071.1 MAG: hypothetical protein A2290_00075 [candidate division WOR-1 bacterium RIFOXYB2_FULL_36_35]OGC19771.1 MAG: hypothetical protein A2282_00860 [candidate division WOR-1 bacterium RIFOXYA12_FULL_36_13]
MNLIGKATIHPLFFYSGKILGYVLWIIYLLSLFNIITNNPPFNFLKIIPYVLSIIGLALVLISMINLGRSTRLGLPDENTIFKSNGLYQLSRNPMYLGFNFFTISAIVFTWNFFIALSGIYSIIIYHFIIIGEEKFLEQAFGSKYIEYKKRVRRYI